MQAMTAIHKPTEQLTIQPNKAIEKGAFSEQLEQSMVQKETATEDSVKEDTAEETLLESEETSQQSEQLDSTEDQINPDAAFLFHRPLTTTEHQLTIQFGQVPVADELGQEKMQPGSDTFQIENLSHLEEVVSTPTKNLMPEVNQQTHAVSMDGKQAVMNTEVESLLSTPPQKQDMFVEESSSSPEKLAVPFLSDESFDKKSTGKEAPLLSEVPEATTAQDGLAVEQKKVTLNTGQQNTVDSSFIMEESVEMKQTQTVAEVGKNDLSDLDIQSDFRLNVTAAKTSETPVAQQPVMQREVQIPVALTNESHSVNQQVLSQAISEVVIDQVTTLKDGQQTTARLSLTPETLGHIKIELKMIDKQLQTTMVVESVETKELLDKSMQQLTTSLAQKNIQLNDVSIQLHIPQESSFTFAESGSQQNTQQQDSEPVMYFDPVEEHHQQKGNEEETSSAGRLSILA